MKNRLLAILSVVAVPFAVAAPAQAAPAPAPAVAPAPKPTRPAPKQVAAGALAPGRSNVISPQDYFRRHLTPAQRSAAAARATAKGRVSATARQASAARAGQKVLGAKGAIAGVSQANLAAAAAALATPGGAAAPRIQTSPRLTPGATPDYFGTVPNYANSPLPQVDAQDKVIPGPVSASSSTPSRGSAPPTRTCWATTSPWRTRTPPPSRGRTTT